MKKNLIATLLVLILTLCLAACSANSETSTSTSSEVASLYKSAAESFISSGDRESAIKVLQEGFNETGDKSLEIMLNTLKSTEDTANTDNETVDSVNQQTEEKSPETEIVDATNTQEVSVPENIGEFASYVGKWEISDFYTEMEFDLSINNSIAEITGKYSYWNFEDLAIENATFTSSSPIKQGSCRFDIRDSYGNTMTMSMFFDSKTLGSKYLKYLTVCALDFNGRNVADQGQARLYNDKYGYFMRTLDLLEYHTNRTYGNNKLSLKSIDENTLAVYYESVSASDRIASIDTTVKLSEAIVDEYVIKVPFTDSWNNKGIMYMELSPGNGGPAVHCSIEITERDSMALWEVMTDPNEALMTDFYY